MNEYFAQDLISEVHKIIGKKNIISYGERSCGDLEFDVTTEGNYNFRRFVRNNSNTMLEKCHCDTQGNTLRFTQPESKGKWSSQIEREKNEAAQLEWEKTISVEQLQEEIESFFARKPRYDIGKNEGDRKIFIECNLCLADSEEVENMYKYIDDNPEAVISQLFLGLFFCHGERYPRWSLRY